MTINRLKLTMLFSLICFLCCSCFSPFDKEDMKRWIEQNHTKWDEAIAEFFAAREETDGFIHHQQHPELYITKDIMQVFCDPEEETLSIYFQGAYSGEGCKYLHYSTSLTGSLIVIDIVKTEDAWQLVNSTERTWRWEGGGIDGSGYIYIEYLCDRWYYVEVFYPT